MYIYIYIYIYIYQKTRQAWVTLATARNHMVSTNLFLYTYIMQRTYSNDFRWRIVWQLFRKNNEEVAVDLFILATISVTSIEL